MDASQRRNGEIMKSITKSKAFVTCLVVLSIGFLSSGFFGKSKEKIEVKGIHSLAVIPFQFTWFKDFSRETGDIVSKSMSDILSDRCKWEAVPIEKIKAAVKKLGIRVDRSVDKADAVKLGRELGVDLVIYGSLPVYDEHEGSREIQEARGGGFTENIREITVQYNFFLVRVADGTLIKNMKIDKKERDTAKDPMMPSSADIQLKHATRKMCKKLAKQFVTD